MSDISKCKNHECPSRESCYRYTAIPNPYRQAYMKFEVKEGSNKCESYWDNKARFSKFRVYNENEDIA